MNSGQWTTFAILAGCGVDLLIGDPHSLYHPVRLIGKLIEGLEKAMRFLFPETRAGERAAGVCLVIGVSGTTALASGLLLWLCRRAGSVPFLLVEVLMSWSLLAARSLRDETMSVYRELQKGDLPGARKAVSMVVGRDTCSLTEEGVTKAAVETIAENASDGVIAPLFYLVVGGPVLGWLYKSINTMDSMVGYKNDRYRYFGTAAARMDDLVNFIPARLSALLMTAASKLCGLDWKNAWRIFRRDRYNHASPNSAQTESVMAGALDLQLAGDAYYFGKLVKKKTIGDLIRPVEAEDIRRADRLMLVTAVLAALLFTGLRGLLILLRG